MYAPPASDLRWPGRVGLMNDYVHVPYANGSSFASQFLYRELTARGVDVTVIGPREHNARPELLPPRTVCLDSVPLRNHPGVYLSFPSERGLKALAQAELDLMLAQTSNAQLYAGAWLRAKRGVPYVCVNTVHLPSVYNTVLPESLMEREQVVRVFRDRLVPWLESSTARVYDQADGLVVLAEGLERYWRARGVTAPIHVIPRAIEPRIFDRDPGPDPFPAGATRGGRLLVVCRQVREKNLTLLLRIFARHVLPHRPGATLTLVGDGPEHDEFRRRASELGLDGHAFFVGERALTDMPAFYAHADLFVYTSLSETYGQVIGEALWCGLPVVALNDGMGVAGQVRDGSDGFLIDPDRSDAAAAFGEQVLQLLGDEHLRADLARRAGQNARRRASPGRVVDAYFDVFEQARRNRREDTTSLRKAREATRRALVQWTSVHSLVAATGLLRRPAVLNRNGSIPPDWNLSSAPATLAAQ